MTETADFHASSAERIESMYKLETLINSETFDRESGKRENISDPFLSKLTQKR
jgi:hypothetical protein